jgi:hypothetical protein
MNERANGKKRCRPEGFIVLGRSILDFQRKTGSFLAFVRLRLLYLLRQPRLDQNFLSSVSVLKAGTGLGFS